MKTTYIKTLAVASIFLFNMGLSQAHDEEEHPEVEIHTFENGESWTNCSFQLHSNLTQEQFKRFTNEGSNIIYFQPLSGASSLGKYKFDVGLVMSSTPIDQTSGAWNNTFGHPVTDLETEDPHWLGDKVQIPNIRVRMGVTDNIEVGTYITKDPEGNYGFWGVDLKYTKVIDTEKNINIAGRTSHAQLFGPKDLNFNTTSIDVLLSKKYSFIEPYIGISSSLNHAKELSDQVELKNINSITPRALVGVKLNYKIASVSAEYDISTLNTFSFKLGASF